VPCLASNEVTTSCGEGKITFLLQFLFISTFYLGIEILSQLDKNEAGSTPVNNFSSNVVVFLQQWPR